MKRLGVICVFVLVSFGMLAQNERKIIRQGVKDYQEGNFSEAEVQFRKATDINHESFEADFNTGAAMYEQKKYEETIRQFQNLADNSADPENLAHVWHNIGNSLLESQKYEQSIEAYKNSLRLNPEDADTKYNLAYARKKLMEQQQQNKDQQKDQQQDQKQDQQQDQKQDEQQQDQKQDQQQQEQEMDQQQARPKPLEISKEDAERMLNAIQQQEKDVKEKVDQQKAAVAKVKTEKDW